MISGIGTEVRLPRGEGGILGEAWGIRVMVSMGLPTSTAVRSQVPRGNRTALSCHGCLGVLALGHRTVPLCSPQISPEEEERRRVRRERNKLAAAKCRNRRKELTDFLQAVGTLARFQTPGAARMLSPPTSPGNRL